MRGGSRGDARPAPARAPARVQEACSFGIMGGMRRYCSVGEHWAGQIEAILQLHLSLSDNSSMFNIDFVKELLNLDR